jgi:hypothetical protein
MYTKKEIILPPQLCLSQVCNYSLTTSLMYNSNPKNTSANRCVENKTPYFLFILSQCISHLWPLVTCSAVDTSWVSSDSIYFFIFYLEIVLDPTGWLPSTSDDSHNSGLKLPTKHIFRFHASLQRMINLIEWLIELKETLPLHVNSQMETMHGQSI